MMGDIEGPIRLYGVLAMLQLKPRSAGEYLMKLFIIGVTVVQDFGIWKMEIRDKMYVAWF